MKRTGKIFGSIASLSLLLNNVAFATTEVVEESKEGLPTKYIFMGVAALVIVLLLFLGYKMDTKDSGITKVSHKAEKTRKKLSAKAEEIQQNSGTYEADEELYEEDGEIFENDDFNEPIEYTEEDSLYSVSNEDEIYEEKKNVGFSTKLEKKSINTDSKESKLESKLEKSDELDDVGEEFDTSIIDGLDEEESNSKNSFDETMLFNNSDFSATGTSLEDEIDNLENIDTESIDNDEDDSFIEELKKFEEPESSFEGFSVASKEQKMEEFKDEEIDSVKKPIEENVEDIEESTSSAPIDNDFLSQMEANLQKNKEDRNAKKYTKSTTNKNKEDK